MNGAFLTLDMSAIEQYSEALGNEARNIPRANRSALASTGWLVTRLLYRSRKALAPLNPHTPVLTLAMKRAYAPSERNAGGWVYKYEGRGKKRKRLKHFQRVGSSRHGTGFADGDNVAPFRKAINAIRYKVEGTDAVRIGFYRGASKSIDFAIAELIARQAEAKDFVVTPQMRKFLFSAGMPVRAGTHIHRPARPWFAMTIENNRSQLQAHYNVQFMEAMERYRTGKAKQ